MDSEINVQDAGKLANEVRRTHGPEALDYAVETARRHLHTAAWKSGALWLQVVNRLNDSKA